MGIREVGLDGSQPAYVGANEGGGRQVREGGKGKEEKEDKGT